MKRARSRVRYNRVLLSCPKGIWVRESHHDLTRDRTWVRWTAGTEKSRIEYLWAHRPWIEVVMPLRVVSNAVILPNCHQQAGLRHVATNNPDENSARRHIAENEYGGGRNSPETDCSLHSRNTHHHTTQPPYGQTLQMPTRFPQSRHTRSETVPSLGGDALCFRW